MDKIEEIKSRIKEIEQFFEGERYVLLCNFKNLLAFINHLIVEVSLIIGLDEEERQSVFWKLKKLRNFLLNKMKKSVEGKVIIL